MSSNNDIAVFAETTYRNEFKKFGIKTDDRRRHMYLIGKTGMGKSTIQENMIVGDIRAGRGVAVVDPHGDLAEKIMEYIPANRIQDVVYFNPADIEFPIAFNVVEQVEPHLQHLVASGLIGVFQKLWADSWGPRLEYILRNAILAILDFPGSTLLGVVRMLSDKAYRKRVVANIKDPVVKAFWEKEFASYADKFASEAVSPIQNKVGQFLSSALMRNIVGQAKSSINLREIMDEGKILIMNLSKGRIGEDNSALLGAMMITKIQLAAMSRVDIPEKERRDFYLYIDEFQNFSTDSFANILSEARKYRLDLILAHQYIEQLSDKVKPAVFGNVGTMVSFRVGAKDAEELAKEFSPVFTEEDLVNLPKYEMYLKLMIDGVASSPFSAKGLPPLTEAEKTGQEEKAIRASREKYATPRSLVEEKIMSWHDDFADDKLAAAKPALATAVSGSVIPAPVKNPDEHQHQEGFKTNCALCGTVTFTPFEPDGIRPVFCKQCLSKKKEERRMEMENKQKAVQTIHSKPVAVQEPVKINIPLSAPKQNPAPQTKPQSNPMNLGALKNTSFNNSQKNHNHRTDFIKPKTPPFRPSAIADMTETPVDTSSKNENIPALSLGDLGKFQPLNFKGKPDKHRNFLKEAEDDKKEDDYLANNDDDKYLKDWPTGEDLEEGKEIKIDNQ